jgi:DNA invertase Pin-like site-specific DNA recombinase
MAVHGYVRPTPTHQVQSVDSQKGAILRYCQANALLPEFRSDAGPPVPAVPFWYVDASTAGMDLLRDREAGGVLCRNVRAGDHVVIAALAPAFRRLADFVAILDDFDRRGACLHICDLLGQPADLSQWGARSLVRLLGTFGELDRASRAERTGLESRARLVRGGGLGRPRLGFRYVARYRKLPGGRMKRYLEQVPDRSERAIMGLILRWRREDPPWSWDQIRQKLNHELELRTRDGREWDVARIRRACEAEAALQLTEAIVARARSEDRRGSVGPAPATDEGRGEGSVRRSAPKRCGAGT